MTVVMLALEHAHIELRLALRAELQLEDLAVLVVCNVERVVIAPTPTWQLVWTNKPEPRAHAGELIRYAVRIHMVDSTRARIGAPAFVYVDGLRGSPFRLRFSMVGHVFLIC